jgi:hypothetical protein
MSNYSYPRNQVTTEAYCGRCGRMTEHRLDWKDTTRRQKIKGPCLPCMRKADAEWEKRRARDEEQRKLFP